MKKVYLLGLFILVGSSTIAQKLNLPLTSFNEVDAFGPFNITLVKSETESMEIDFKGIDKEDVIFEVERGILKLKLKNRHYMNDWKENQRQSKYIIVTVHYKDIDVLQASAGAIITANEVLKSKYLTVECTMGGEMTLEIVAQKVEAISNMGGVLEMSGQTDLLNVKANMGGVLKAAHLESKVVYVKANMGADVMVNVLEELNASAGFGANVDYIGGPSVKHRNTSKNFGGEVNRRGN